MPSHDKINDTTAAGRRTIDRLLELRRALSAQIPDRCDELVLLATWNIREFDSRAYGNRPKERLAVVFDSTKVSFGTNPPQERSTSSTSCTGHSLTSRRTGPRWKRSSPTEPVAISASTATATATTTNKHPDQQRRWYRDYWRTHQMSDHLPPWTAIRVDNTDHDLASRLQ